jgi:hypothetical protein
VNTLTKKEAQPNSWQLQPTCIKWKRLST